MVGAALPGHRPADVPHLAHAARNRSRQEYILIQKN
jgi:hypothetical protein